MSNYILTLAYGCGLEKRLQAYADSKRLADVVGPMTVWKLDERRPEFPMMVVSTDVSDGEVTRTAAADGTLGPATPCAVLNGGDSSSWLYLLVVLVFGALLAILAAYGITARRRTSGSRSPRT